MMPPVYKNFGKDSGANLPGMPDALPQIPGLPEMDVSSFIDYRIYDLLRAQSMIVLDIRDQDPRIYLNTRQLIETVPDPAWRRRTLELLGQLLGEHSYDSPEGHDACIAVTGRVTDWQARHSPGMISYNLVGTE